MEKKLEHGEELDLEDLIDGSDVDALLAYLKEKPRAERGSEVIYIDTGNNLKHINIDRHAVVFGRRGSGKTMLLGEVEKSAKVAGKGVIWIDIDDYKNLAFPDILIQILRQIFESVEADLIRVAPFYKPLKWFQTRKCISKVRAEKKFLSGLLQRFENADTTIALSQSEKNSKNDSSEISTKGSLTAAKRSGTSKEKTIGKSETSVGRDEKINHISRHVHDAKRLWENSKAPVAERYFIILDDFYHLRPSNQARVLDYLQTLTKNLKTYVKVGTIAHRSNLYQSGNVLIEGMQAEHDILPVDLDRTFQNFQDVESFLDQLFAQISESIEAKENLRDIFGGKSWKQLLLASGGVPRDFINILAKAIELGRSKGRGIIDVATINEASNLYLRNTKQGDLQRDKDADTSELERMIIAIREFCCVIRKRNMFLINKDDLEKHPLEAELIKQLLDFRFIHLVHENTSSTNQPGRFEAYMLDVGLYAHPQKRGTNRVVQVDFLQRDDKNRNDAIRSQPVFVFEEHASFGEGDPFAEPAESSDSDEDIEPQSSDDPQMEFELK